MGILIPGKHRYLKSLCWRIRRLLFTREYQPVVIQDDLERQLGYLAQDIARTQGEGMIFFRSVDIILICLYFFGAPEKGTDNKKEFYQLLYLWVREKAICFTRHRHLLYAGL